MWELGVMRWIKKSSERGLFQISCVLITKSGGGFRMDIGGGGETGKFRSREILWGFSNSGDVNHV